MRCSVTAASQTKNEELHRAKTPQVAVAAFLIVSANEFCSFGSYNLATAILCGQVFFELECIVCPGLTLQEMELGKTDLHVSVTLLDNDLDLRRRNRCHLGLLSLTITESPPRMHLQ